MENSRLALLVVDVQKDFCPGGALAVADGDAVVPVINRVAGRVAAAGGAVFASRDWHLADASHFAEFGGTWPVHCVQGTAGAAFHDDLALPPATRIVSKGDRPGEDGYDALEGRLDSGESLGAALLALGVEHLFVAGLATDYCVKQSALGARRAGFDVTVLTDGVRGVNVSPGDDERALSELERAGVRLATSADLLATLDAGRSRIARSPS